MNIREKWNNYYKSSCLKRLGPIDKEKILILEKNDEVYNHKLNQYDAIILLEPLNQTFDILSYFDYLNKNTHGLCKIYFFYFSKRWFLIFKLLEFLGITKKLDHDEFSYIDNSKINLFLNSCNYSINSTINVSNFIFNIKYLNFLFEFLNGLIPFFDIFSFCKIQCISSKNNLNKVNFKPSIIIPCKNEEHNITRIFFELKKIKIDFEAVFVDDKSHDNTCEKILQEMNINKNIKVKIVEGQGINKYRAVRSGVLKATNDICIILDADLAVKATEVEQCLKLMKNNNVELVNCSRFVYRQKKFSMRFLNFYGNKFFSILFSIIVKDQITDTLCGTKAFYKKDWKLFENFANETKNLDKWGDFNLIFGSYYYGLKVQELPVRYYARTSGLSKMTNRLKRFFQMLSACFFAFIFFNS